MASREGDTALWLHNKLGSTDDFWSGRSICSQLTQDKLQSILGCFQALQPHVKVKLMLSFLHLARRNVEEWKVDLEEILELASNDSDQWVSTVADILRSFPSTGALNLQLDDTNPTFSSIVTDLKKLVKKSADAGMLPLECLYLNTKALTSLAGQPPQPVKHFALKRKPKSAALRVELLQKSTEAANNVKKGTTTHSLPIKVRSFAKKMDDTTPLKGIPNKTGFRAPAAIGNRLGGTPLSHRTPTGARKSGGIKLLDITEQPVGGKEAKRRKKQADQEATEQQKKEKDQASATPDYAAGLFSPATPRPTSQTASAGGSLPHTGPSYVPAPASRLPTIAGGTTTLPTSSVSAATQAARENLQQQLQQQLNNSQIRTQGQTQSVSNVQQQLQQQQQQQQQSNQNQQKKGLSLTREQMMEAQEMFRTSNKVTRPEKALILGFMAGARENPCPQQGDIVNIHLSEAIENVQQTGITKQMIADTYFVMNYASGEWKRVKKYRDMQPTDSALKT
ncbi:negative elongation factor A [Lingula anatina]|uniref:Negative elongation factor A n=1 Tax=Lingula anatina TaxID=7574 RepID=A0A1S3I1B3_LINAN|nr:negative elongation factor A [Lingula anatina]|eukprot:XP_013392050.1 negative elongation factor A [Lingula anatina]